MREIRLGHWDPSIGVPIYMIHHDEKVHTLQSFAPVISGYISPASSVILMLEISDNGSYVFYYFCNYCFCNYFEVAHFMLFLVQLDIVRGVS